MKHSKTPHHRPSPDEQHVLEHLTVRPTEPHKRQRFNQLIVQHHYLESAERVGEQLRYVATSKGQSLALASWSAPALHRKPRETFIGGTEPQRLPVPIFAKAPVTWRLPK